MILGGLGACGAHLGKTTEKISGFGLDLVWIWIVLGTVLKQIGDNVDSKKELFLQGRVGGHFRQFWCPDASKKRTMSSLFGDMRRNVGPLRNLRRHERIAYVAVRK